MSVWRLDTCSELPSKLHLLKYIMSSTLGLIKQERSRGDLKREWELFRDKEPSLAIGKLRHPVSVNL